MEKIFKAVVVISAIDKMSRVINDAANKSISALNKMKKQADDVSKSAFSFGRDAGALGLATGASLVAPIKAFSDLEDAGLRLKATMLKDGGVIDAAVFKSVNAEAVRLGNKLPGTTADFQNMFATMIRGGLDAKSVMNGVGQAAAFLAVGLELPFEEAGRGVAKLREAAGVADKDMMSFIDTIARADAVGVKFDEMQFAFSRSAGQLKFLKLQGLEASKSVSALYAMLIKGGASGETVGTGISTALSNIYDPKKMQAANEQAAKFGVKLNFIDSKSGQFLGVENFVAQLDKLKNINPDKMSEILAPLFGATGQDSQFIKSIASGGIASYNDMVKRMQSQATLQQKVSLQLGSLKNLADAATGTFTNMIAGFAGTFSPEIKRVTVAFGAFSEKLSGWIEKNPKVAKAVGLLVAGFAAVALGAAAVGLTVGAAAKVVSLASTGFSVAAKGVKLLQFAMFSARYYAFIFSGFLKANVIPMLIRMNAVLLANPFILIAAAAVVAGLLIWKYWEPIKAFFAKLWEPVKGAFLKFNNWFKGFGKFLIVPLMPFIGIPLLIINNWSKIKSFFVTLGGFLKSAFLGYFNFINNLQSVFYNAGKNIINSIWRGMKSLISKPVEMIAEMTKKAREYLPFSPAKKGAFQDIHKVKIIETIAQSIKPAPLVRAMRATTFAAVAAVPLAMSAATGSAGSPSPRAGAGSSASASAGVSVVYSPQITINGGATPEAKADFAELLRKHEAEISRIVQNAISRKERAKF